MDEKYYDNRIANENQDFSLEDILAEYKGYPVGTPADGSSLTDRSKRIVMEAIGDTVGQASFGSIDEIVEDTVSEEMVAAAKEVIAKAEAVPGPEPVVEDEEPAAQTAEPVYAEPAQEEAPSAEETVEKVISEYELQGLVDSDETERYASFDPELDFLEEEAESVVRRRTDKSVSKEKFLSPIVAILALITHRRSRRAQADSELATADEEDADIPEMEPEKAAKFYGNQLAGLRFRGRVAAGLSLVMLYITLAFDSFLPLAGAMKGTTASSLVLLIMLISVMVCGLDVLTAGIMSLVRGRPTADSLVSVSCVLAAIDALAIAFLKTADYGLPFCAIAAISMTASIWGAYYTAKGMRYGFRVLGGKKATAVTAEKGISSRATALMKSGRGISGAVKRSEQADFGEYVYNNLTPVVLAFALAFGVLASLLHGQGKAFFHCVSVMVAVGASFSAGLCFALPFAVTAKKLYSSGAAICGWAGARDIGRSGNVVITDGDIFPQGTVEISSIRVLEGSMADKIISYTGSVVVASGNGMAGAFSELISRNGYSLCRVENFIPHDGGGMTAVVNGENVMVGSTAFMNLMGIRVPQKIATKNTVFTAINGALVGIFDMNYKTVPVVQNALGLLQRSKREPIFALRDFNISPTSIENRFHLPADKINFPSFSERFRISGAEIGRESPVAAVISREGIVPMVETSERGRKLYLGVLAGTGIAAFAGLIGLVIMFVLCWNGNFEAAAASKVLLYMLLAALPELIISIWLQR